MAAMNPNQGPPNSSGGRMSLANVSCNKSERGLRVLLYGVEGCGKTTWASNAPDPVFLGCEDGYGALRVQHFRDPESWNDVFDAVYNLTTSREKQSLVLDTVDWLEPLCWAHVCRVGGKQKIDDFDYGKGFTAATDEWRRLLSALERLQRTRPGFNVILLGHAQVKTIKRPEGTDYSRYTLKTHEKASGLLREWCDVVGFAQHENTTAKIDGKVKGVSTGARVMHTEWQAAFDAKNRYSLPAVMPLDYEMFAQAIERGGRELSELVAEYTTLVSALPESEQKAPRDWLEKKREDRAWMLRGVNRLRTMVNALQSA